MRGDTPARRYGPEPGPEEVAPGVYRIALPLTGFALSSVNVYAVVDRDEIVLIDCGSSSPAGIAALDNGLRSIGYGLGAVRRCVVTHAHSDHLGGVHGVRTAGHARISIGSGEAASIAAMNSGVPPLHTQLRRLRRSGAGALAEQISTEPRREQESRPSSDPDDWLDDGSHLVLSDRTLAVLATPGHTRGHTCFADFSARWLAAGDHILPRISPSLGFERVENRAALTDYLASLRRVRRLPELTLFPAHGEVGMSTHRRVDELLAHHARRLDEMTGQVRGAGTTALDVASALRWTRRETPFGDLDSRAQMMAVLETDLHLAHLSDRSVIETRELDGTLVYRR